MPYDAPHWNWGVGSCKLHRGQDLPCKVCIETKAPGLSGSAEPEAASGQLSQEQYDAFNNDPSKLSFTVIGAVSGRMSSGQPNPAPDSISKEQMRELQRRADASMQEVSKNIDLDLFERVVSEYGKLEPVSHERIENPDSEHRWKAGGKPMFSAQFRSEKGEMVTVPIDPNDLHARMIVQIAQEQQYTFEQYQANFRDLRIVAKNRNFGKLYNNTFINELQTEFRDSGRLFDEKDLGKARIVDIPVNMILFREVPPITDVNEMLCQSIRQGGLARPLIVSPLGNGLYEVIEDSANLVAAKKAGLQSVKCLIGMPLVGSVQVVAKSGLSAKKTSIILNKKIADLGKHLGVNPCDEIFLTDTDK